MCLWRGEGLVRHVRHDGLGFAWLANRRLDEPQLPAPCYRALLLMPPGPNSGSLADGHRGLRGGSARRADVEVTVDEERDALSYSLPLKTQIPHRFDERMRQFVCTGSCSLPRRLSAL